jgi:hypothetical protein
MKKRLFQVYKPAVSESMHPAVPESTHPPYPSLEHARRIPVYKSRRVSECAGRNAHSVAPCAQAGGGVQRSDALAVRRGLQTASAWKDSRRWSGRCLCLCVDKQTRVCRPSEMVGSMVAVFACMLTRLCLNGKDAWIFAWIAVFACV